jgi:hypothetical protein
MIGAARGSGEKAHVELILDPGTEPDCQILAVVTIEGATHVPS